MQRKKLIKVTSYTVFSIFLHGWQTKLYLLIYRRNVNHTSGSKLQFIQENNFINLLGECLPDFIFCESYRVFSNPLVIFIKETKFEEESGTKESYVHSKSFGRSLCRSSKENTKTISYNRNGKTESILAVLCSQFQINHSACWLNKRASKLDLTVTKI